VAKSDWFPRLSLTGDIGAESVSVSNWFAPGSRFWSIGPSLQWKALDFGRVRAEVHTQTAVQEAAAASYQKAVLVALEEAENAIVACAQEQQRHQALAESQGRVSYLDVLDARRSLYASDDQVSLSAQSVSVDLIALYKALGGGWESLPQAQVSEP
jgi:outer membrane protein TolC